MTRSSFRLLNPIILFLLCIVFVTISGCKNDDSKDELEVEETVDLTHLPFGGSSILRRDRGDTQPDFESLWLCGVPPDGAGNSDASDWTNSDGTWDYTRKPIVEGSVTWLSEFEISRQGS